MKKIAYYFQISLFIPEIFKFLKYANQLIDDVIYSTKQRNTANVRQFREKPNFKSNFHHYFKPCKNDGSPTIFLKLNNGTKFPCKHNPNTHPCVPTNDQKMVACVVWRFQQFESKRTKRRSCEELPAWMTRIFYCCPGQIF